MSTSTTFIGLDAHKETIVAAILHPRRKDAEIVELANTEQSLRRFVRSLRQQSRSQLRACYEAAPQRRAAVAGADASSPVAAAYRGGSGTAASAASARRRRR